MKAYKFCNNKTNLSKKNGYDAALDIKANDFFEILPGESKIITTGLYIAIPQGCVGLVWSRSGMSVKNKIEVGAGCIDATYRGELLVHLYNFGKEPYYVYDGDRIAQLLTIPVFLGQYELVDELKWEQIKNTDRGQDGFGSTGR
jgi:dUTP pyrophosphatase